MVLDVLPPKRDFSSKVCKSRSAGSRAAAVHAVGHGRMCCLLPSCCPGALCIRWGCALVELEENSNDKGYTLCLQPGFAHQLPLPKHMSCGRAWIVNTREEYWSKQACISQLALPSPQNKVQIFISGADSLEVRCCSRKTTNLGRHSLQDQITEDGRKG